MALLWTNNACSSCCRTWIPNLHCPVTAAQSNNFHHSTRLSPLLDLPVFWPFTIGDQKLGYCRLWYILGLCGAGKFIRFALLYITLRYFTLTFQLLSLCWLDSNVEWNWGRISNTWGWGAKLSTHANACIQGSRNADVQINAQRKTEVQAALSTPMKTDMKTHW